MRKLQIKFTSAGCDIVVVVVSGASLAATNPRQTFNSKLSNAIASLRLAAAAPDECCQ